MKPFPTNIILAIVALLLAVLLVSARVQVETLHDIADTYEQQIIQDTQHEAELHEQLEELEARPPEVKYVEVEIEIVKEVPIELKYFASTDELEAFLAESDVDHTLYGRDGVLDFLNYDCEDYAIALRNDANSKGYYMNIQIVRNYKRPDTGEYLPFHALNSIIIGNEIYYIEPQTDGYWFDSFLDDPQLTSIDGDEIPDRAVSTGKKPKPPKGGGKK